MLGCSSVKATEHRVLVSQAGSTTIAAIDPVTGKLAQRITVGELPHRMLVTRDGRTVYAVLVGSQAIAELDSQSLRVRRTFLTAPVPAKRADGSVIQEHVDQDAFSHSTCFDCHKAGGAKPFIVGERPVGIALSEDESHLYVSHIQGARLSVIELGTGSVERSVVLPPAKTAVQAADLVRVGRYLAVSLRPVQPSHDPGVARLLDIDSLEQVAEQATGSDPAALTPVESRQAVLISNFDSNTVSELSVDSPARDFQVTPGPLGSMLLPGTEQVLTLDYYSNGASLLDLATGQSQSFDLSLDGHAFVNPTHAALSPDGSKAYVVSSGTDGHLLELELSSQRVLRAFAIDGLSFDTVVVPHQ